jgi:pimeloyl-ACP methyl ester carboxylesterase
MKRETMANSTQTDATISKPDKKITYAIPHEEEGGCLFLYGKRDAAHIVLTCAGFPDDHGSFGPLAQRLAKESNCLVGVTCLAGFDDRPEKPWRSHHKEGFTFLEMVASLHEAAKVLRAHSTNPKAKFTAIFHDWGSLVGLMFTNRALRLERDDSSAGHAFTPDQVVLFDVCLGAHPKATNVPVPPRKSILYVLYDLSVQVAYRGLLALCFLLQNYVSSQMAANLFSYGFILLNFLRLSPVRAIDNKLSSVAPSSKGAKDHLHRITYMAYPYYYLWKVILTGRMVEDLIGAHLPKDLTTTPVLYLYGLDKNIHFHQDDGLCLLQHEHEQGRRSNAIAVKEAGHWLYQQQAEYCFAQVDAFIQELQSVVN